MHVMKKLSRALGALGAASALVLVAAPPANAGFDVHPHCGWYGQSCATAGQAVLVGTGSEYVAVTCTATTQSELLAQVTGVKCWLLGYFSGNRYDLGTRWTQGPQSTLVAYRGPLIAEAYLVCVTAGYITESGDVYEPEDDAAVCGFPL